MTVDQNKLSALLRQQNDRISELESALRATQKNQPYVSFKEKTLRDALKSTPNYYVWEITFAQWAAQRTPVTIQTDPRGYFFAERMWMSWRTTGGGAGAAQGHWNAVASSNPYTIGAAMTAAAPSPFPLMGIDFYFEYSEGSASLMRMNAAVPSSILYRGDLDGVIPGSDGWQPSTTVTFFITPIGVFAGGTGTPQAGVLNITVGGIQAYQTLL